MELELVQKFSEYLSAGDHSAVIFLLVVIIAYLLHDVRKKNTMLEDVYKTLITAKDNQIIASTQMLEKQHSVTLSMIAALNEIKVVLTTIKDTL